MGVLLGYGAGVDVNKADAMNRTRLRRGDGRAGVVKQLLFVGGAPTRRSGRGQRPDGLRGRARSARRGRLLQNYHRRRRRHS